MLLLFVHSRTNRLQYVADFCSQFFSQPLTIINNEEEFAVTDGIRINYSNKAISNNEIWIKPSGFLDQTNIQEFDVPVRKHNQQTILFPSDSGYHFDIFSALFYLLSRYEEYLPHEKDSYGRYSHTNSLAYKNNFLHLPIIDFWLRDLEDVIINQFPNYQDEILEQSNKFRFQPTYDIDIAWSYKNKGLLRNLGGLAISITKRRWAAGKQRLQVLTGRKQDPFDSYSWMNELHREYDLKPVYFFHVGQKRNQYDKNIPTNNKEYQQLIKLTGSKNKIGLHPSWYSGDETKMLGKEKAILEKIAQQPVIASRQHYIRFTLPATYRLLIENDIYEDYSMGYGTVNGFRASVSQPFYWYDLEREQETHLLLHPFCFMDANSFFEQKQTTAEALEELIHYYHTVKDVEGILTTIWHNTFLGNDPLFKGWREIYEEFMKKINDREDANSFSASG